MAERKRINCTLTKYCYVMGEMAHYDDHAKGIVTWNILNIETGKSRSLVGYKSKASERGVVFNHCPWCGCDYRPKFKSRSRDGGKVR